MLKLTVNGEQYKTKTIQLGGEEIHGIPPWVTVYNKPSNPCVVVRVPSQPSTRLRLDNFLNIDLFKRRVIMEWKSAVREYQKTKGYHPPRAVYQKGVKRKPNQLKKRTFSNKPPVVKDDSVVVIIIPAGEFIQKIKSIMENL